jgi:hypothetical protein
VQAFRISCRSVSIVRASDPPRKHREQALSRQVNMPWQPNGLAYRLQVSYVQHLQLHSGPHTHVVTDLLIRSFST